MKDILDFVDSYCKCITDGESGLDEPNRATLEHDIKKWALGLVGEDEELECCEQCDSLFPTETWTRNDLRKEIKERINEKTK